MQESTGQRLVTRRKARARRPWYETDRMKQPSKEELYLRGATGWQYRRKHTDSALGQEIFSYLQQHSKAFEKNAPLVDLWKSIVPAGLAGFCRLDKRVGNVLYIQAMPGPYMHQVKMLSAELLESIRRAIPRSGICSIKVVPMEAPEQGRG